MKFTEGQITGILWGLGFFIFIILMGFGISKVDVAYSYQASYYRCVNVAVDNNRSVDECNKIIELKNHD